MRRNGRLNRIWEVGAGERGSAGDDGPRRKPPRVAFQ